MALAWNIFRVHLLVQISHYFVFVICRGNRGIVLDRYVIGLSRLSKSVNDKPGSIGEWQWNFFFDKLRVLFGILFCFPGLAYSEFEVLAILRIIVTVSCSCLCLLSLDADHRDLAIFGDTKVFIIALFGILLDYQRRL